MSNQVSVAFLFFLPKSIELSRVLERETCWPRNDHNLIKSAVLTQTDLLLTQLGQNLDLQQKEMKSLPSSRIYVNMSEG